MFIDELTLRLKSGRGGNGVERWLHEKGKDKGGPAGGNGGKGGDVYAVAIRDIGVLNSYRQVKEFSAGRGEDGFKNSKKGGEGEDIEIKLPIGSRITNLTTNHTFELIRDGEKILLLKGGRGGLGNEHFKSSVNVSPTETTEGEDGEEADFHIELLLVVDLGLIGLPNAGKSSLLNVLTRAKSKVGGFPFTTLEPHLGDHYGLIVADIPGLIEGASEGRGLGHKFLRHIERTKALIHLVSSEEENPEEAYKVVRKELALYNEEILNKPELVLLTKIDMISEEEKSLKLEALKKVAKEVMAISILDDESIKKLSEYLTQKFK